MEIIKATTQHIPAIQEIVAITWPDTYGPILSQEQIGYMLDLFYNTAALEAQFLQGHQFIMAIEDGTYYGFAGFELNHDHQPQTKLHKLYILPDTQGKGIGKRLLDIVQTMAIQAGQDKLLLNVNRYNSALGFYKKNGFTIQAEIDITIGNGYFMNDYVLEKKLIFC